MHTCRIRSKAPQVLVDDAGYEAHGVQHPRVKKGRKAAIRKADLAFSQRYSGMQEVCLDGLVHPNITEATAHSQFSVPDSTAVICVHPTLPSLPLTPPAGHSAPGDRKKTDEEHEHTIPGKPLQTWLLRTVTLTALGG
jgi:hypothetical protein